MLWMGVEGRHAKERAVVGRESGESNGVEAVSVIQVSCVGAYD